MVLSIDDKTAIPALLKCLKNGGTAIIPCDTIYGIVGRVPDTDDKIRGIKGREETNPFLQLARDVDSVKRICAMKIPDEMLSLWPGPVTMIFNDNQGSSRAVRVPADPFLSKVIRQVDFFIYSTSVNISGTPPMNNISQIIEAFSNKVDIVVDGGDLPKGMASTLVDIRERPFKILRQGKAVIPEDLLNLS